MKINSKTRFLLFCLIVAIVKFWLIARSEIVSIPDDSAVYARQSLGPWILGYPEGYPAWLSLCRSVEIPQRIAIELLYLGAALWVASALRRWFGTLAGYLSFLLLAFSSSTIFLFNFGLADGFFACLTLFALGLTIKVLLANSIRGVVFWSCGLGAVMGLMAITRSEDPLLAVWVLHLMICIALLRRTAGNRLNRWSMWKVPALAGISMTAICCFIVVCLCTSYWITDGVFARAVALIPGHVKLLDNLARIDTGELEIRFIPITKKSREMAYAVSPTFARYRSIIENPHDPWQQESRRWGIPAGEIGGGWMWHAINTNVIAVCGGSHRCAESEYKKINAEIDKGFRDGKLRKRFVLNALIGGDPLHLLSELPPSINTVTTAMLSATPENTNDQGFEDDVFNAVFVRRAALLQYSGDTSIQGWAFVNKPGRRITNLVISSPSTSNADVARQDRPDVISGFTKRNGWQPFVIGFHADLKNTRANQIHLTYSLDDGSVVETDQLVPLQVSTIPNKTVPGEDVVQGLDEAGASGSKVDGDIRHAIEQFLFVMSTKAMLRRFAFFAVLLGVMMSCIRFARTREYIFKSRLLFSSFVLLLIGTRILFYSIIDARAWPGNQIRYVTPAHELWLVLISLSLVILLMEIGNLMGQSGGERKATPLMRPSTRKREPNVLASV